MSKTAKRIDVNSLRRGDMSVVDLQANAQKLNELAGQLQLLIDNAQQEKIDSLKIDGITKLSRGLDLIRDFTANATQAIIKAKFGK